MPEGPIVLVGHSMGGMTIMALADAHPELFGDQVLGVALLSTSAGEVGSAGLTDRYQVFDDATSAKVWLLAGRAPLMRSQSMIATSPKKAGCAQVNTVPWYWGTSSPVTLNAR